MSFRKNLPGSGLTSVGDSDVLARLRVVYLLASVASLGRDVAAILLFGADGSTDAVYIGLLPFMLLGSLVAADSMDNIVQPVLGARSGDEPASVAEVATIRTWAGRAGLVMVALTVPLFGALALATWLVGGDQLEISAATAALSCPAIYVTARANALASLIRRERHQLGVAYAILGMNLVGAVFVVGLAAAGMDVFSIVTGYLGSALVYAVAIRVIASRRLPSGGLTWRRVKGRHGGYPADGLPVALRRSAWSVMGAASLGHVNLLAERLISVFFGAGVMTAVQYGRKFCVTAGGLLGGVQAVVDFPEWTRRGAAIERRRVLEVFGLGALGAVGIVVVIRVVPLGMEGSGLIREAVSAFALVLAPYCVLTYAQRFLYALSEVRIVMVAMLIMAILPLPVILVLAAWLSPVVSIAAGFGGAVAASLLVYWRRILTVEKVRHQNLNVR